MNTHRIIMNPLPNVPTQHPTTGPTRPVLNVAPQPRPVLNPMPNPPPSSGRPIIIMNPAPNSASDLTAKSVKRFTAAYNKLSQKQKNAKELPHGLPLGEHMTSLRVGNTVQSISFGRPVTLLIPDGAFAPGAKHDPNAAKTFYIEVGPSTNVRETQYYGPFTTK